MARGDAGGMMRAQWIAPPPGNIRAIALGLDQTLWVLQAGRLDRIGPTGTPLAGYSLAGHFANGEPAERLALDGPGSQLWIASRRQLLRYDLASPAAPLGGESFAADIQGIALHPTSGQPWMVSSEELKRFARSGAAVGQTTAASLGLSSIGRVEFDAANDAFWLSGGQDLLEFAGDGTLAAHYALGTTAQRRGVAPFKLMPAINLIRPPQHAPSNNALPRFTPQYGANCLGPCDLVSSDYTGFSYTVTLKPGLNTFTLAAVDGAGNTTTQPLNVTYAGGAPGLALAITAPTDGAAIAGDRVLVSGTYQGPANTGITVNGVIAATDGTGFHASVPLTQGSNALIVATTAPDGATLVKSIVVTGAGPSPFSVSVTPAEGIGPLEVSFGIAASGGARIQNIAVDADGDGAADLATADPGAALTYTYSVPGLYLATVTVTDIFGNAHSAAVPVRVRTYQEMDAMLRGVYQGMLTKLQQQDVPGALTAVTAGAYKKYEAIFQALQPNLPAIIPMLGELVAGTIGGELAEYVLVRGSGDAAQSFLIYFLRGDDGVWRIDEM